MQNAGISGTCWWRGSLVFQAALIGFAWCFWVSSAEEVRQVVGLILNCINTMRLNYVIPGLTRCSVIFVCHSSVMRGWLFVLFKFSSVLRTFHQLSQFLEATTGVQQNM